MDGSLVSKTQLLWSPSSQQEALQGAECGAALPSTLAAGGAEGSVWDIPWPRGLSAGRECCAGSHDWSLTLPCRHRSHWKKWCTAAPRYCSPIVAQQKCLAPSLKMRDLLESWVFGCLVQSDIFLLRGSERDLHITVFRPAAECDDFSFLKWTNIFPRSEWVCVCVSRSLSVSLSAV